MTTDTARTGLQLRSLVKGDGTLELSLIALATPEPTQDLHFRLRGPVVAQLLTAFAFDWMFTTSEALNGPAWAATVEPAGDVFARGITARDCAAPT